MSIYPSFIRQKGKTFVFFVMQDKKLRYYYKDGEEMKQASVAFQEAPTEEVLEDKVKEIMATVDI